MLPLAKGEQTPWREELLYEYYWERNFPQTPTVHALRGDRYKYMHFYGVWENCQINSMKFCWAFDTPSAVTPPPCSRQIPSVLAARATRHGSTDAAAC